MNVSKFEILQLSSCARKNVVAKVISRVMALNILCLFNHKSYVCAAEYNFLRFLHFSSGVFATSQLQNLCMCVCLYGLTLHCDLLTYLNDVGRSQGIFLIRIYSKNVSFAQKNFHLTSHAKM